MINLTFYKPIISRGGDNLYETVKELCKKKNISVSRLEKEAGLGNGTIAAWKQFEPKLSTLEKVADALGISVTTLINKSKKKVE